MLSFFKNERVKSTVKVWKALVKLNEFLQKDFITFIQSQSVIDVSNWQFINEPLHILETESVNMDFILYDFAKNEIFINTLQIEVNKLLDLLREYLKDNSKGLNSINLQINSLRRKYFLKLNEFRNLAESYTNEKYELNMN